jgi:hypothetical protein
MTVRPKRIRVLGVTSPRTWKPDESALTNRDEDADDIEGELNLASDPVWPDMPHAEFKRIGMYMRDTADRLGLRDWFFSLNWEPSEHEDADASIEVTFGRKHAAVSLGRDFAYFDDDRKKHCIIHELLHCHLDSLESMLRATLPDLLGQPTWSVVESVEHERIEQVTDVLAEVMAKYLPDMPASDVVIFEEET